MKKPAAIISFIIVISMLSISLSCSKGKVEKQYLQLKLINEDSRQVTYSGYSGKRISIKKKPKRVVVLFNSFLDLWYFAGGKAIARVNGKINVPDAAKNIEIVGNLGNPNLEKIIALKPDLVIINREMRGQRKLKGFLDSSGIKSIELSYFNYNDFLFISDLFCRINDNKKGLKKINVIKSKVDSIISRCPKSNNPLVMITFATPSNITTELPTGDTGAMLKMLNGRNIAKDSPIKKGIRVDMSIETITAMNPDIMLVKMMGRQEQVETRMNSYFQNNSSLNGIKAIKNKKIYYLPRTYFMYKPNARYPEAFLYLAKILYPEIFSK